MAAALWSLVEQGRSLLIAARCGGAGKSTLVTSLLDAMPPERPRCFARGVHQDQGELTRLKTGSAILVNEISPHMPIYCWGAALRDVMKCVSNGVQLLATIHADSVTEIVLQLRSDTPENPLEVVDSLGWAVFLEFAQDGHGTSRRVRALQQLAASNRERHAAVMSTGSGVDHLLETTGIDRQLVARRTALIEQLASSHPMKPNLPEFAAAMRAVA